MKTKLHFKGGSLDGTTRVEAHIPPPSSVCPPLYGDIGEHYRCVSDRAVSLSEWGVWYELEDGGDGMKGNSTTTNLWMTANMAEFSNKVELDQLDNMISEAIKAGLLEGRHCLEFRSQGVLVTFKALKLAFMPGLSAAGPEPAHDPDAARLKKRLANVRALAELLPPGTPMQGLLLRLTEEE